MLVGETGRFYTVLTVLEDASNISPGNQSYRWKLNASKQWARTYHVAERKDEHLGLIEDLATQKKCFFSNVINKSPERS